jgi:hypothetical protein
MSDCVSENKIMVLGSPREIERWRSVAENSDGSICMDGCITPPKSLTSLPLNHCQNDTFGLEDWRRSVQGTLIKNSRCCDHTNQTVHYEAETVHGDLLKFIYQASKAFHNLEYTLSVKKDSEIARYYVRGGCVEPQSEREV